MMKKPIYCTIVAANYLPRALLLRDSIFRQHGEVEFCVLMAEHPSVVARMRSEVPGVALLAPNEVGCREWLHMAFFYDVMEFSTALKPSLIRTLMKRGSVVYFDPDIEVFSPLDEIEHAVAEHDVVLTPHVSEPLFDDGHQPRMLDILRVGQFNLGFIGVQAAPENDRLMAWWQEMLSEHAISDLSEGLFTDQMWAAAFASFARRLKVLRSASLNLAYWNVPQRELIWDGQSTPRTQDGPLVFFHYSGTPKDDLKRVSVHQNRVTAPEGSPLYRLLDSYRKRLSESPYRRFSSQPYSFGTYVDGTPIQLQHRRAFLRLPQANRRTIVNPFVERAFIEKLVEGAQPSNGACSWNEFTRLNARVADLERQLNTLPHSLIGYSASAMDVMLPGSRHHVYNVLRGVASKYGADVWRLRQFIKKT